jgi:hypothetical protein
MGQTELRRHLRTQLEEAQREFDQAVAEHRRRQSEWAEDERRLKAKVAEIYRLIDATGRAVTFLEMYRQVAEERLESGVFEAVMAETARRLQEVAGESHDGSSGGAAGA